MRTPLSFGARAEFRFASKATLVLGLTGLLLVAGCQQHSAAWDDQWAECHAHSIEQGEFADVDRDQSTTWRERYVGACMQAKGFHDPQSLVGGQQGGRN